MLEWRTISFRAAEVRVNKSCPRQDDYGDRPRRNFSPDDIPWDQIRKGTRRGLLMLALLVVLLLGWTMIYRIEASDEGVVLSVREVSCHGSFWPACENALAG